MNTQTYNNRHAWLAVKNTIGISSAPSFLDAGCISQYKQVHKNKQTAHLESQQTYYIDILGIFLKLTTFWKTLLGNCKSSSQMVQSFHYETSRF